MGNIISYLKGKSLAIIDFFSKYEKFFLWLAFIFFIVLTSCGIFTHEPWLDEAQAWLIAQDLSIGEMFNHMKYEGHLCLWFLALMPSAKLNLPYPLPMLITNVVFIWGAVYVLLMKSPFHPILRMMIAFSMPIAYQYGIIARPYAMGVMFLFLLATLYKDKLKRPFLYATLIILCANTSSMALVGAVAFGVLFIYDYVKENKEFWKKREFHVLSVMALFCVAIIGFQLLGAGKQIDVYSLAYLREDNLLYLFFKVLYSGLFNGFYSGFMYIIPALILFSAIRVIRKSPKVLFFFIFTYAFLLLIFLKAYNGYRWHHMFFFIYLVISVWLMNYENKVVLKAREYKGFLAVFIVLLVNSLYNSWVYFKEDITQRVSNMEQYAGELAKIQVFRQSNLVICEEGMSAVVPYLREKGVQAYSCHDGKDASFFNRKYGEHWIMQSYMLSPKYFRQFESRRIFVLFKYRESSRLRSDYYDLVPIFCMPPAKLDSAPLCSMELVRKYKDE